MERPARHALAALACLLLPPLAAACNEARTITRTVTVTSGTTVTVTNASTESTAADSSTTSSTTTAPLPDGTKPTSTSRCHTSQLSAHFVAGSPGAGQRYATLLISNRNSTPCTLYGYPGAQLIGASGRPIQTKIVRDRSRSVQAHTIVFDQQAKSEWHWTAVPGGDEPQSGACQPTAKTILVTPPDETTSLKLEWPFDAVCGHGRIDVTPIAIVTGK